jgi:hypothetical protein
MKRFQQKLEAKEAKLHEKGQRNESPVNLRFAREPFDFGFSHFEVVCLSIGRTNHSESGFNTGFSCIPITWATWTKSGFIIPSRRLAQNVRSDELFKLWYVDDVSRIRWMFVKRV